MKQIPRAALADLITLGVEPGSNSSDRELHLLDRLKPFEEVNRLHWESWNAVTNTLSSEDLACLARGLVRAERHHQWCGGSVAAAIWVFRMFQSRFPQQSDELAEWMLANSDNDWVPFGSLRGRARSLADFAVHQEDKKARRRASEADASLKQHLRKIREAVRHRLAAERRVLQAGASSSRRELLEKLRAVSLRERIEHLAWDDFHLLDFYPVELADGSLRLICEADVVSLQRLVSKAMSRRRGPWRSWINGLRKACVEDRAFAIAHGLEALCEDKTQRVTARVNENANGR